MQEPKTHSPLWYHLDNKDRYLIWYTSESNEEADGCVVGADSKISSFHSLNDLRTSAGGEGLDVDQGTLWLHNLDVLTK